MKILVGCERSGAVRRAFRARGHEAYSCDLVPADDGGEHLLMDVLEAIAHGCSGGDWDMGIFFPPCTFLNSAGLHWIARGRIEADGRPRAQHQAEALELVRRILGAPIAKIALENPIGCIGTIIRPYDQKIQPYEFGDDASKQTCLWLKGLPLLPIKPENRCPGRWVTHNGKRVERWANQTDSGQNNLGPSANRPTLRGITYPGIARAMAETWG